MLWYIFITFFIRMTLLCSFFSLGTPLKVITVKVIIISQISELCLFFLFLSQQLYPDLVLLFHLVRYFVRFPRKTLNIPCCIVHLHSFVCIHLSILFWHCWLVVFNIFFSEYRGVSLVPQPPNLKDQSLVSKVLLLNKLLLLQIRSFICRLLVHRWHFISQLSASKTG